MADIDHILSTSIIHPKNIRLVQGKNHAASDQYVSDDGFINSASVLKLFDSGYTIVLEQMQRYIKNLHQLCADLTDDTGYDYQTNVYVTPPDSQGFDVHYDTHDVFVLQIFGSKEWLIYDSSIKLPLAGQTHDIFNCAGEISEQHVMQPGDLLYIPRGYYHQAKSLGSTSVHITLGSLAKTWANFLVDAVALACTKDPELRKNFPPIRIRGSEHDIPYGTRQKFEEHLSNIQKLSIFEETFRQFSRDIISRRRPAHFSTRSLSSNSNNVTMNSKVVARHRPLHWESQSGQITVNAFEKEISFPAHAKDSIQSILSGDIMLVEEIEGSLDENGKLALVRRLIMEGLLEIVEIK